MRSTEIDPFSEAMTPNARVVQRREIYSSLPLSERHIETSWRKIVEAGSEEEFFTNLAALDDYRATGLHTPPFTASIEQWADGGEDSYVLYVGHVTGSQHDQIDMQHPQILKDYMELGTGILDYLDTCWSNDKPYLYDITKIDQFIYGTSGTTPTPMPLLVDLELHYAYGFDKQELRWFTDEFLVPIEKSSGTHQTLLRHKIIELAEKYTLNRLS